MLEAKHIFTYNAADRRIESGADAQRRSVERYRHLL